MRFSNSFLRNSFFVFFCLFICLSARAQRPLGIDVYSGSGTITWTTVKSSGFAYAWTKATEGTGYHDAPLAVNEVNGKAAGIYMGAYDFAHPEANSPVTEANYFWNYAGAYIKNDGKSLMPMLDYETFTGTYVGASSYADWANQWCLSIQTNAAAHGVTVTPVIYISSCNACELSGSLDAGWGAWLANYNGESSSTGNPWNTCTSCEIWGANVWSLWQFTSSAIIPGVPGNSSGYCDEDVYNGTLSGFIQSFVIGGTNAPNITKNLTSITTGVGSNVTFAVQAAGLSPLTFRWYYNGNLISGATSSNYTIANAQLANAGSYYAAVSNSYGNVQSSSAYMWVLAPMTNAPGSALAPANLVSWWPGDSNSIDIYGNNNAIPNGNLYYAAGKVGAAFHFDSSTSYLTPTTTSELSPNWTLCMWVNRQNASGTSASIMGDTTYALKLEQYNGTRQIGITKSGVADYVFHCSLPQNTWTHLALVNSGSAISVYSNAVLVTSTLYSNGVAIVTPSGIPLPRGCIGGDLLANGSLTDPMLGSLDEIQIYSRALSATEIGNIYNAGGAGLVRAPEFTGVSDTGGTQIQLNVRGITSKNLKIYTSTDLMTWTLLGSVANPNGSITYPGSITNGQQFYRVSQ